MSDEIRSSSFNKEISPAGANKYLFCKILYALAEAFEEFNSVQSIAAISKVFDFVALLKLTLLQSIASMDASLNSE